MAKKLALETQLDRCYRCNGPATTREHVPPRCLFPESKDANGEDYRANLTTVPSCELHNLKKSKDDEFLMVSIAGILGNNSIGYSHQLTKVSRAIKRSSQELLRAAFNHGEITKFSLKGNKYLSVIFGTPNVPRLQNSFTSIAYGCYLDFYNVVFDGEIKLVLDFLYHQDKEPETWKDFVHHRTEMELSTEKKNGSNPKVFYYQMAKPDQIGLIAFKLCFYENVVVYGAFVPKGTQLPFNLGMELMKSGIKTVIDLEGKKYEFN